ncbi:MAG: bifunctional lysylphosphatidylglycerol flippase/synthetase MprF [Peptostreptococcaceae bacterium]
MNKHKLLKWIKIVFALAIFIIVMKEFSNVFASFDMDIFKRYADKLTISNMLIIAALGMISYLPLSFYDFILKKRVGIKLSNIKLYKYSLIASSIASIAGFGGSTAIALKTNFYKDHVKDTKLLVKEITKIVALNLTGFSMVCFVYVITNFSNLRVDKFVSIMTVLISTYFPILSIYLLVKFIKGSSEDKEDIKDSVQVMAISALEWITTIFLIYSIMRILGEPVSIGKFLPIFVVAIVAAIVSMAPGGIGSFDITLLLGLKALGVPSEKVLLAVFLYRVSYYIIPLIIGLILYIQDYFVNLDEEVKDIITTALSKLAHIIIILLVLLSGVSLLISEASPDLARKFHIVNKFSYFSIVHIPQRISIIIGFLLIAISRVMSYKSKGIYKITLTLIIGATLLTLVMDPDYYRSIYLIVVAILIWASKKAFYRESFVMRWGVFAQDIILLFSFLVLYIYTVYANLNGKIGRLPIANYKIQSIKHYGSSLLGFSISGFIIAVFLLWILYKINSDNDFPRMKLDECKNEVKDIIDKFGGSPVIHYIYLNDKFVYINESKDVLLQYQISGNKIIILGNPVGNEEKVFETIQQFYNLADLYGYVPVFTAIDKTMMPDLHETGYEFMKLGEDALVDLKNFTLEGRKMKSVRNALSRVEKEGYTFELVKPPFTDEFFDSLKEVSDEWLRGREEKGFYIGFFDKEYLNKQPIAIVRNAENEIKGFSNLMPMYDDNQTLSIDLMRFSHDTCNGIMDFIFVNLFKWGQEEGYSRFNMGMAPLSNVGVSKYSFLSEKVAAQIYSHGQNFYSFEGLKKFKEKYCDIWEGKYMAYRKKTSILTTAIQIIMMAEKPISKLK